MNTMREVDVLRYILIFFGLAKKQGGGGGGGGKSYTYTDDGDGNITITEES